MKQNYTAIIEWLQNLVEHDRWLSTPQITKLLDLAKVLLYEKEFALAELEMLKNRQNMITTTDVKEWSIVSWVVPKDRMIDAICLYITRYTDKSEKTIDKIKLSDFYEYIKDDEYTDDEE